MEPAFLTVDEVLEIHRQQIALYGGLDGLRDRHGLESAIAAPAVTFEGRYLHSSVPGMAAAYLFHLCQNHPFVDGNKRTGANSAISFLLMNDWEPELEEDELFDLVTSVAAGKLGKEALIRAFESRCRKI